MTAWLIGLFVVGLLLGTMCGYYIRIHWKKISGFDENARGFLQRVEDTADGWFHKGRVAASKHYEATINSLKSELRDLQDQLQNKE